MSLIIILNFSSINKKRFSIFISGVVGPFFVTAAYDPTGVFMFVLLMFVLISFFGVNFVRCVCLYLQSFLSQTPLVRLRRHISAGCN